ncbi:nucleotidyltransferase family protein [Shewanella inventionis]|uniref:Mannose-1-phosphate guanylyltransferase n=1 Tax=Shewanella inventionis TaxID=1738770 RepID=A0ABQ1J9Q8_9GAMM|nr:nucleotidyltransferase family protein [Shewanella inventionis]MCL1158697.1 nucleotidyltransferase family protein [Shewanella inventionis]UAL42885.1 nucleotidyltransferase family protein [Shewanella inventionis]GGB61386.1 mannose-1-phosphate guanylyltransferase [Shewanella inventionis]
MKAMILAAGRGERLRPLTDTLPKPLVNVAGKPLIEYHLEKLAQLGVKEVVINHAWLGHKLPQVLGDGQRWGITIHYSGETEALETAGGIKQALPLLGTDPFLVINGDIFIDTLPGNLNWAVEQVSQGHAAAFLWLVDNPEHHPQGDFSVDAASTLSVNDSQKLTFSGIGVYHPQFFNPVPAGKQALGPLLKEAISKQQVKGAYFNTYWCDVGTLARLEQLERRLQALV